MTESDFNIIYKKYYKGLLYLASKLVGKEVAEDFVSIAFVKLWELGYHPRPEGFLKLTVKNSCLDHIKHEKRKAFHLDKMSDSTTSEEYADSLVIAGDLINLINEKVKNLPPAEKKVFDLLYMKQLSPQETSQELNISVNTVRVLKMRLDNDFKYLETKIFNKNCWIYRGDHYELSKRYSK